MVPGRIVIVDDDVLDRKLLRTILEGEEDLEVAGVAASSATVVSRITRLAPDLVAMDLELARADGMEVLARIRARWPELPVLVLCGQGESVPEATLEALAAGASDFVTRPCRDADGTVPVEQLRRELLSKVRVLCGRDATLGTTTFRRKPSLDQPVAAPSAQARPHRRPELVAMGISTGGPAVLRELLPRLDPLISCPVVLVQHMSRMFLELLVERLDRDCPLPVAIAIAGEKPKPGHVYVAPGDYHLTLVRVGSSVEFELNQEPPENSCRPSVDQLFRSAAAVYGPGVLGVVMTGMGRDGLDGARCIKERGGEMIVQDESTSVVWGMPGAIAHRGLADAVLPASAIPSEINARFRRGHGTTPDQAIAG